MAVKVDLLGETLLADGRFKLTLTSVKVAETDGATRTLSHEIYHQAGAAALLLFDPTRGTVLLVRQFRLGAYMNDSTPGLLEACAGTIDPGEAPDACMKREAMEEMGLRVENLRPLFEAFVSPAATTEKLYFFVAPYAPEARVGVGGGMEEEGEEIEVVEAAFDEILREAEAGALRDGKTLTLLYWLKASGLMG